MSTRIYIYRTTDEKIEEMAEKLCITKSDVVMIAIENYYRRMKKFEQAAG